MAIGSTVHEPPSVVFNEEKSGATAVVPKQYSTDSKSDEESEVDVSTGGIMHMPFAHTQEEHEDENDVQDVSEGAGTEMEGAGFGETQAEQAAVQEQDVRHSSRVRRSPDFYEPGAAMMLGDNKEHPDASNLLDHSCMEGYACAVGAQILPTLPTCKSSGMHLLKESLPSSGTWELFLECPKQMFLLVLQFYIPILELNFCFFFYVSHFFLLSHAGVTLTATLLSTNITCVCVVITKKRGLISKKYIRLRQRPTLHGCCRLRQHIGTCIQVYHWHASKHIANLLDWTLPLLLPILSEL
jgi:hypothetical protein